MSRPSRTESAYDQADPHGMCLCPDRPRRKVPMTRPTHTECVYVQTVPDGKCLCPDYHAFKSFSALFVRSKSNRPRPSQTKNVYVQTFVRSCPDHRALQIKFVQSKTKVLVRPCRDHRAFMSRLSCVHVQTFVRSPD